MKPRSEKLSHDEVRQRVTTLPGWSLRDGALFREIRFGSFAEAFGFMASAAIVAQELDHHPDWTNVYDLVTIRLGSHDVKGISDRDFTLAERMNELLD